VGVFQQGDSLLHQTSVDRYVHFNKDVWRVVCARCGVLADDLGRYAAAYVESCMAKQECSLPSDVANGRLTWSDSQGHSLSDEQALAAWSTLLEWSAAGRAVDVVGLDGA
jgi:hypothetical protein